MAKYSHAYDFCSEALDIVNLSSEGKGSFNANDLTIGGVGTGELDSISAIRSIGWDIPVQFELVISVISLTILIILIIEGRAVPVDMYVKGINFSRGAHGSDKVELDGGSLGQRVRGDGGVVLIEMESRSLRITVAPGDGTRIGKLVVELLVEHVLASLDEVVHKVGRLGPVGEVSLDSVFLNNVSGGKSNSGGLHFL